MTDRDNIELPPLPSMLDISGINAYAEKYARAAVRADRERRAKQEAKPAVHEAHLSLASNGSWREAKMAEKECARITLRWTDNGRAWIESERNRELARRLRNNTYLRCDLDRAAAALDGGVR